MLSGVHLLFLCSPALCFCPIWLPSLTFYVLLAASLTDSPFYNCQSAASLAASLFALASLAASLYTLASLAASLAASLHTPASLAASLAASLHASLHASFMTQSSSPRFPPPPLPYLSPNSPL